MAAVDGIVEVLIFRNTIEMSCNMHRKRQFMVFIAAAALLLSACGGGASGETEDDVTLKFANFVGPEAPQSLVITWWMDEIADSSNVKFNSFDSGTLLGAPEMLQGVANGQADLGFITAQYFPAELPLTMAGTVPFVTSNDTAQVAAWTELYETNDAFREEWRKQGVEVLFFVPTSGPSVLGTSFPVASASDLKGHTIRTAGLLSNAVDAAGGAAAALSAAELYESMQRGVVDGWTALAWNNIPDFALGEVTSHIADAGLGNITVAAVVMNRAKWDSLSNDLQEAFASAAAGTVAEAAAVTESVSKQTCELLVGQGVKLSVMDDDAVTAWKDQVQDDLVARWKESAKGASVDLDDFWNEYTGLIETHSDEGSNITQVADCLAN